LQSARAAALAAEAAEAELRGALIEYNLDVVDAALAAINESLAAGKVALLSRLVVPSLKVVYKSHISTWRLGTPLPRLVICTLGL
jgi:hypothetical protein